MSSGPDILLTGATGFLGRYLLGDLLARGRRVVILVRDGRAASDSVAGLVASRSAALGRQLPMPLILSGDLRAPGLGLGPADRHWLSGRCGTAVHAAALVSFGRTPAGEPWITNVDGTRRLLELCRDLGVSDFHHISTAFVCGDRAGRVYEDELDCGQCFRNDYEHSKYEAERVVHQAGGIRATVYRPSVIVGDSRTGDTGAYHGLYRFLELADRLAEPALSGPGAGARRLLALRLPFTGDEPHNLVPVDWVARAVVSLVNSPRCHGRTYHLVAARPVLMKEIKEAAEEVLNLGGVELAGPGAPAPWFLEQVRAYWPYLNGAPAFDSGNTSAALPTLPPAVVDRPLLARLIRFGKADRWGRRRPARRGLAGFDCARYVEHFLPGVVGRSALARVVTLDLCVGIDVRGRRGGQWSCVWSGGQLAGVRRSLEGAEVTYHTDAPTFEAVVAGRQSPQEAFCARRIDVTGDVEKALKLAVLFGQFVKEFPYDPPLDTEATDAAPCHA